MDDPVHIEAINAATPHNTIPQSQAVVAQKDRAPHVALQSHDLANRHVRRAQLHRVIRVVQEHVTHLTAITHEIRSVGGIHPTSRCLHVKQARWPVGISISGGVEQDCPVTPLWSPTNRHVADVNGEVCGGVTACNFQESTHDAPFPGLVVIAEQAVAVGPASAIRPLEILPHLLPEVIGSVAHQGAAADAPKPTDGDRTNAL
mmetsp:Transcript_31142/g.82881  ORF Transcript_31142/g.82881 Transcript_31142/m.82881 type:complete len:203 (+) Transcript_31142:191-799(+)